MEITQNQVVSRRIVATTKVEDMTLEFTSIISEEEKVSSASGTIKNTTTEEPLGNFSYDYNSIHAYSQSEEKSQIELTKAVFVAIEELISKIGHYDE